MSSDYIEGSAYIITFDLSAKSILNAKRHLKFLTGFYFLEGFNIIVIEQTESLSVSSNIGETQFQIINPMKRLVIEKDHRERLNLLLRILPGAKLRFAKFAYTLYGSNF